MDLNQQKAQLSLAYVHALSAAAGAKVSHWLVDDESVDITVGMSGGMVRCVHRVWTCN